MNLFTGLVNEPKKIAAIAVFVIAAILTIGQVISFIQDRNNANAPQTLVNGKKNQDIIDARSVLFRVPLFGKWAPVLSGAEIRQSTLDLEISGIMYSSRKTGSQVLIKASGGAEQVCVAGDTLPGGAIIRKISKKGIVVLYNGELESLSLPKNELLFEKPAKPLIEE